MGGSTRLARTTGKKDPYKWREDNHDRAIPDYVRKRRILDSGDLCGSCGVRVRPGNGHIDHIVPLENGGEHVWGNLQYLCTLCHREKTSKENSTRAKGNRVFAKTYGIAKSKRKPFYAKRERSTLPLRVAWIDEQGRDRVTWLKPTQSDDADN
jgi:hypothetical protein